MELTSEKADFFVHKSMGGSCSQPDKLSQNPLDADLERVAERQEVDARKARLIRIQLQRTGKPDIEITVDPLDLVLKSIDRELGLGKLEQATEAYLGELRLEGESAWEPQGIVDQAEVIAVVVKLEAIVVVDSGNNRLQLLAPDGAHLKTIGSKGSGPGQFNNPYGVAVDGDGNWLVADYGNHRLQLLTPDGTHLKTIGSQGSGPGQFYNPTSVAVDGDGNWLVADSYNHRLQLMTPDGAHLKTIGSRGSGPGQFKYPSGAIVVC